MFKQEQEIVAIEAKLRDAMLAGDVATLDVLIAPDLICVDLAGRIVTKADDLAAHRSGVLKITRLDLQERRIVPLEQAAVVIVLMDAAAHVDGQEFAGLLRYTRVWRRDAGGWRIAAAHLSNVA